MSSVQVVVRLRPLNSKEKKHGTLPVVSASTADKSVTVIKGSGSRQARSSYNFDNVFTAFSTQEEVFDATLKPVLSDVLKGFESTVFAYGQTGTGKTFTMEGDIDDPDLQGVIPRSAKALFEALESPEYTESNVNVSFLEIYNEDLCDLLQPEQTKLDIMVGKNGPFCRGLSSTTVENADQVLELMRKAQDQRQVGETNMNKQSSRSHCIFTISVNAKRSLPGENSTLEISGKLHCVDLAGSECAKSADLEKGNEAQVARERERKNINQSLLTLGRVVSMLKEQSSGKKKQNVRIPYRDSKLTRILQESLGGRCKTCLIATLSPSVTAIEESMSTLNYAQKANGIINKPITTSLISTGGSGNGFPASVASGATSSKNEVASVELWQEMETRLEYMKSQVEEAQQALARKHLQQQELVERAEKAEESKAQMEKMLDAATAENNSLKDEIETHKTDKENLKAELTTTQKTLKETAVILKATQTTEQSLTEEAQILLKSLRQSIQDSQMMHGDLLEQRKQEIRRKHSTKEFHDSSLDLLKSVDNALTVLLELERDFVQLIRGDTQDVVEKLATFFQNQHQSLDTLTLDVHSSSDSMQAKLKNHLVVVSEEMTAKLQIQAQEAQKVLKDGNESLVTACQDIKNRLKASSVYLNEMKSSHQASSEDLVAKVLKKVSETSKNLESLVSTATSSMDKIHQERLASTQALQSMVEKWYSNTTNSTNLVMASADGRSKDILELLKELMDHESYHKEMEKYLEDERDFLQKNRESHFGSLEAQKEMIQKQNQALEENRKRESEFRQQFLQSVLTGVQTLMQNQVQLWEAKCEERFQADTDRSSRLSKEFSQLEKSSETILSTVEVTNKSLEDNMVHVRKNHSYVSKFLQETNVDMKNIQENCAQNLSSIQEQAHNVQNELTSFNNKQEKSFELCQKTLKSRGEECKAILSKDMSSALKSGVAHLLNSSDKVFDHVDASLIPSMEESMDQKVKENVESIFKASLKSFGNISAAAEEVKASVEHQANEHCDLLQKMEACVDSSAKDLQQQITSKTAFVQEFGTTFSNTVSKHGSLASDNIQICRERTMDVRNGNKTFTFDTMEVAKETPEVPELKKPSFSSDFSKTPPDDTILQEFYSTSDDGNEKENDFNSTFQDEEVKPMVDNFDGPKTTVVLQDKSMNEEEVSGSSSGSMEEVSKRRTSETRSGSRLKKPRTHI